MTFSRTSLANMALDLVGKDTLLDLDSDTTPTGKLVQRNFEPVLERCLRRSQWPWAIRRMALNPSGDTPVNQFSYVFNLPPRLLKLIQVWPSNMPYKVENGQILCDESVITVKYISGDVIDDPSDMDPSFAMYFAAELAAMLSYKVSDSVNLRNDLRQSAFQLFQEAAALYSQEDTEDALEESPWITVRDNGVFDDGTIRIDTLET